MNLKKLFPLSYKNTDSIGSFIVGILLYVAAAIVAGLLIGFAGMLTGWIPFVGAVIGWLLRIVGILVEIYVIAGIILQVLVYLKLVK